MPDITLCSMEEYGAHTSLGISVPLATPAKVAGAVSSGLGSWRALMGVLFTEQGAGQWLVCLVSRNY